MLVSSSCRIKKRNIAVSSCNNNDFFLLHIPSKEEEKNFVLIKSDWYIMHGSGR